MSSALITGQQWIPQSYFDATHAQKIRDDFAAGKNFCLGAADEGVDRMAQTLLVKLCEESKSEESFKRVTIFDKKDKDGRLDKRFLLKNGYKDYPARDTQAALACDAEPICCLAQYGNGTSGTVPPLLITSLMNSPQFALALGEFANSVFLYSEDIARVPKEAKQKLIVSLAHDVSNIIRAHSEPWNNELIETTIAPMYDTLYKK